MGVRVLLVDTDRSASLSNIFAIRERAPHGFTQVIVRGVASQGCVSATHLCNVDLIYSDDEQDDLRGWLIGRFDALSRLRTALRNPFVNEHYDVIFIDTQGASGPVHSTCIMAADLLLCPVVPDILSAREFIDSTYDLTENLESAGSAGARVPGRNVTVLYRHEDKVTDARRTAEMIRREHLKLRGKVDLLQTVVPSSVCFARR
jgi:chromosome partitioning related protein ParA